MLMHRKLPKLALVALFFSISAFFLIHQNQKIAAQQNVAELTGVGSTLSQQMAYIAGPLILSEDWVSLNVALKRLTENPFIISADIINPKGEVLAQVGKQSGQKFEQSIGSDKNTLGTVRLYLDQESLSTSVSDSAKTLSGFILVAHFLLFAFVTLLYRNTTRMTPQSIPEQTQQQGEVSQEFEADDEEGDITTKILDETLQETPIATTEETLPSQEHSTASDPIPLTNRANSETPDNNIRYFVIFINCRQGSSHLLEHEAREELLYLYQQLFERVCEIYRGAFSHDTNGNWLAQFPQEIMKEQGADLQLKIHCGSNALCAAQLFKSLYRKLNQQRIMQMKPVLNLKIGLVAGENPEQLKIDACDITNATESNEVITSHELYTFTALRQLLIDGGVVTRAEKGSYLIHQLASDFQQLIDRQAEHFLQTNKEEESA